MTPAYKRMIGVFGWRETELAAVAILDAQWDRPFDPVNEQIFTDTSEKEGFAELKRNGWIDGNNVPSRAFWAKVHGR